MMIQHEVVGRINLRGVSMDTVLKELARQGVAHGPLQYDTAQSLYRQEPVRSSRTVAIGSVEIREWFSHPPRLVDVYKVACELDYAHLPVAVGLLAATLDQGLLFRRLWIGHLPFLLPSGSALRVLCISQDRTGRLIGFRDYYPNERLDLDEVFLFEIAPWHQHCSP